MKKHLLLLCFTLITGFALHAASLFPGPGLEISFRLSENDMPVNDYYIFVYENGKLKDSLYADLDLPVFLQFKLNRNYTLKFRKAGFADRVVNVETAVPAGRERGKFSLDFEIPMIHKSDAPAGQHAAFVRFDNDMDTFNSVESEDAGTSQASKADAPAAAEAPGKE